MLGNTFNISGQVFQGAMLLNTGYVKCRNLNKPEVTAIVPIGQFDDGRQELGRYHVLFTVQQGYDVVVEVGNVFELTVYDTLLDATNEQSPISVSNLTEPITPSQLDLAYLNYQVQVQVNTIPTVPIVNLEDNLRYTNNKTIYWTWNSPEDINGDGIHFQLEWSRTSNFEPEFTVTHDTTQNLDRSFFSYQDVNNNWIDFPATGIPLLNYLKKVKIKLTMTTDGYFYWRVRATDRIDS